jgi:hypothetical protein
MDHKLFILKDGLANPRWELRNQDVRIPRIINGKNVGLREIQWVDGASSIWKEENSTEGTPKAQWFSEGSLSVPAIDLIKLEYLQAHPEFNVTFELYDPEAKAEAEFAELELVEKARELLRAVSDDEDKMAATAASLFGATALDKGAKETKLLCYNHAALKPKEVIAALNDGSTHAKYIAALGFRKNIVVTNPQQTAVVWNDASQGVICHVPVGQKPLTIFGEFLFDEDNLVTLQEIGKRVEELTKVSEDKAVKKAKKA